MKIIKSFSDFETANLGINEPYVFINSYDEDETYISVELAYSRKVANFYLLEDAIVYARWLHEAWLNKQS